LIESETLEIMAIIHPCLNHIWRAILMAIIKLYISGFTSFHPFELK